MVLVAFVTGVAGSFLHRSGLHVGSVRIPYGVVLAVGSTLLLVALVRAATASRLALALAAAGWILGVIPFTIKRPEGDLVIASGAAGLLFLFGGVLVMSVSIGLPTQTISNQRAGGRVH